MKTVLTIAGSDPSGGAGIQADLKTMTCLGVYGMSVITALTAQNTTGVVGIFESEPEFVEQQLDCIFTDIRPDAVKIGMVANAAIIRSIAAKLRQYQAEHIVVDPVMVSTSGSVLLQNDALTALKEELFPLAEVITPNLKEGEQLCGFDINTKEDMLRAADTIGCKLTGAVALKGGHSLADADDLLMMDGEPYWYRAKRIENMNSHGTGCTLSSAIACFLALDHSLPEAFDHAKAYITACLHAGLNLGAGNGPLHHNYAIAEGGSK
ncbi:bifunctional hydroxymethylpyrimidine kinase/phosphomethylpyrimidine kinase [Paenibacillus massiliensis]|uniref:bifunctional hydroxymethylpyrimidine kinase/phosphomethylpyrimidine kinase n=1 Tax=Paenibacillus massiliensis TaxID=225917 RepID=UPI00046F1590|nr:bifunctional hydroxymethylpyrimidine kinase/phosphomethylpyrimidine kinase [Paenibacillus massiliensis]